MLKIRDSVGEDRRGSYNTQLLSDFDLKLMEEGFRNFDSKPLTEKEKRFIKKSNMRG